MDLPVHLHDVRLKAAPTLLSFLPSEERKDSISLLRDANQQLHVRGGNCSGKDHAYEVRLDLDELLNLPKKVGLCKECALFPTGLSHVFQKLAALDLSRRVRVALEGALEELSTQELLSRRSLVVDLYGHMKEGAGSERADVQEARIHLGLELGRIDLLWRDKGKSLLRRDFAGGDALVSLPYEELSDHQRFSGLLRLCILSSLEALSPAGLGLLLLPAGAVRALEADGYHVVNGGGPEAGDTPAIYDTAIRLYEPTEATGYEDLLHTVRTARLACR